MASHLYANQRLLRIASIKNNKHGGNRMHIAQPAVQPPHLNFLENAARVARDDAVDPTGVGQRKAAFIPTDTHTTG